MKAEAVGGMDEMFSLFPSKTWFEERQE